MPEVKETGRLEQFSDGVFAIAITLLALDLKDPLQREVTSSRDLWLQLAVAWPSFFTFFTSFGAVLTMWVSHHQMFELINKINKPLLFVNGFILMLVVTVPFITTLLTRYLMSPTGNAATALYTGVFTLINIAWLLLWHVVARDRALLKPGVEESTVAHMFKTLRWGIPAYVTVFIVSFFSVGIAVAILTLLWVYWAIHSAMTFGATHSKTL